MSKLAFPLLTLVNTWYFLKALFDTFSPAAEVGDFIWLIVTFIVTSYSWMYIIKKHKKKA